ncbi:helix-turn-helix domain-containing protein [Gimibacter soli]|uniref:Helix-turn-helix transcriptional regulator n=1 Tax=Gimibacter soli TaxID=3024400 RepID=A0AAE9XNU9_9PROT|nr:helix-turn-helix transcriptional regulator [Gimibacter soli]WCL53591.1 helix-turn-helix transcriptional regulator [Gimibacter soli]
MSRKSEESGEIMTADTPLERAAMIDAQVAARLAEARRDQGLSLSALGQAAGVSYQQIQKYENGRNRISCGMLSVLAGFLERPIEWFFDAAESTRAPDKPSAPDPIDKAIGELLMAVRQSRYGRRQAGS